MEWGDGRLAAAVEASERSVAVDPQSLIAHWMRGYVLALNARYAEAEQDDRWLTATSPDSPYRRQLSGLLHAAAGRPDAASEVLAPLDDVHLDHHESFHVAESYAMAGDIDRALDLLESALEQGFYPVAFTRTHNPLLHNVRSQPRFAALLQRVEMKAAEFETALNGDRRSSMA
jgi:pentatricopeptide repeat protein